jgi:hypothetical protein
MSYEFLKHCNIIDILLIETGEDCEEILANVLKTDIGINLDKLSEFFTISDRPYLIFEPWSELHFNMIKDDPKILRDLEFIQFKDITELIIAYGVWCLRNEYPIVYFNSDGKSILNENIKEAIEYRTSDSNSLEIDVRSGAIITVFAKLLYITPSLLMTEIDKFRDLRPRTVSRDDLYREITYDLDIKPSCKCDECDPKLYRCPQPMPPISIGNIILKQDSSYCHDNLWLEESNSLRRIMYYAIRYDKLEVLKYACKCVVTWDPALCVLATYYNNLEALKILYTHGCPMNKKTLAMAFKCSSPILNFLENEIEMSLKIQSCKHYHPALMMAGRDSEYFEYMLDNSYIPLSGVTMDAIYHAGRNGLISNKLIESLGHAKKYVTWNSNSDILEQAIREINQLGGGGEKFSDENIKAFIELGCPLTSRALLLAIHHGRKLDLIKFMISSGCPIGSQMVFEPYMRLDGVDTEAQFKELVTYLYSLKRGNEPTHGQYRQIASKGVFGVQLLLDLGCKINFNLLIDELLWMSNVTGRKGGYTELINFCEKKLQEE